MKVSVVADYKESMNLPKTEFPMRANLAQREPAWLQRWDEIDIYRRALEKRAGAPAFILHDGPPYANGHIHMGTAYNKVLKDIIVKYKTMRGYYSPYVPGWDCHGQPIEHQVEKNLGPEKMKTISQAHLRADCRKYALKFVGVQRDEFKRLGVIGDWDDPYLTLNHAYEAGNVRIFKKMYQDGAIFKGAKPIHWCVRCHTALAEAEIEYGDETSTSIYVAFRFTDSTAWDEYGPVSVLIWTTTPWTLPANVAVTLADDADYVGVRLSDGRVMVMAEELVEQVAGIAGWEGHEVLGPRIKGSALSGLKYAQPIHDDVSGVVITGSHVELTTGTGAVHTAPGHGDEDYQVGLKFGLPMPMPVLDDGTFDEGGGPFVGLSVKAANPEIVKWLEERGTLIAATEINHSYPHCWRCKQPVIFRATEQWFVSMERTGLRDAAMRAISEVEWIPGWSVNRISAMVGDRPDWCISRQRAWGVPIPVFTCSKCGETVATDATFDAVINLFEIEGADAWFTREPHEYLPEETVCGRCGAGPESLKPENDIVDVWWESGVSHTSVLEARDELHRPAELYLEGSDQHRGWFQSSLLTSVGAYGHAPYERVLTHGFIVDGDGRKMSKSVGNVVSPLDVIKTSGADIIRLWVASADYGQDVSVSSEILDRTSEAYRRVRNTFRFLLSNLFDFDPATDTVEWTDMPELDRFALVQLSDALDAVTTHFDEWHFYAAMRTISDYLGELSSVYLDVLKDRLYADAPKSVSRRGAQTVLAAILGTLVRMLAPVLSFTCDEVWGFMPVALRDEQSVLLADWPTVDVPAQEGDALRVSYTEVLLAREAVTKALEDARNAKEIGKSQEARVVLKMPAAAYEILIHRSARDLAELFIVSEVELIRSDTLEVSILPAAGDKCPRCWNFRPLGIDGNHPDVCERCASVLTELGA
ncbi:MAG: isoleucine--tRNA ligase [Actinobacteria bacterium HGW-Actinobacteria-7]|jgi:isoleucyl-tRNA synthetase|nr:MAG: isoleucine--tRNA ligase [Actinobacteria bacterium HGW-Actinobacteria-7]